MKKKGRKKGSVLSRQKLKRGKNLPLSARLRRFGLIALAAVALGAGVYGYVQWQKSAPLADGRPRPIDWKVSIKLADDTPLADKAQDEIILTARKYLGKGTKKELTHTAQVIQQLDSYADVHLIKLAPDQVAVNVRQRTPVLCIEADRLRLVSSAGEVYGQADRANPASCPGPTLTGVFDPGTRFTMRGDFTLALGENEKTVAHEAVDLLKAAHDKGFTFSKMEVQKYRGFFVTLASNETEVSMGRAPFNGKLEKLQDILDKLAKKNEQASRIELDYQGKAFIKLKKM